MIVIVFQLPFYSCHAWNSHFIRLGYGFSFKIMPLSAYRYKMRIPLKCSFNLEFNHVLGVCFKSDARIAQSAERLTRNEQVRGSNPRPGYSHFLLRLFVRIMPLSA